MRVMFTVSHWPGHYFCMVPLGWALQAAGHEVRVACPPGQAEAVSRAGLIALPVLHSPDMMTMTRMMVYGEAVAGEHPGGDLPLHPFTGEPVERLSDFDYAVEGPRFWQSCEAQVAASYDAAVQTARTWRPELVLHDLMTPEGALAAELTGATAVYHPPGLFGTRETEPGVDLGDGDPSGSFARYGLKPWTGERIRYAVDTSPPGAVPPFGDTERLPVRYVPYNGPGELPDWVARRTGRRITVIWGSSAAGAAVGAGALRAALTAAARTGAEVVLTTSREQARALGELPAGVRVLERFPLHLLLQYSDAVVHHGSVNCLMTAAAAGVPQLALPLNDEQKTVSARLSATGAVLSRPALSSSDGDVAQALELVLGDATAEAAAAVRDAIAAYPSPAEVAGQLTRLATSG